jgi:hypothetical protein
MKQDNFKPLPQYMEKVTNLKQTTNQQWRWLSEGRCSHRHRYTSHFNCFLKEYNIEEKIAYLDTEFYVGKNSWGKLAGDWGFILCWVIGDGKGNYAWDVIKPQEVFTVQDKRIVTSCVKELSKYDRVVHQYGNHADIPLLRTRALAHGLDFPSYGEIATTDIYQIAKHKLCLSSNSQKMISKLLFGKTEKTEVDPKIWLAAVRGNKTALARILIHCKADVRDLERNAKKLMKYSRKSNISI